MRIARCIGLSLGLILLGEHLLAQEGSTLSTEQRSDDPLAFDWARLGRFRPLPPFDNDMGYRLLDALTLRMSQDTIRKPPRPLVRILTPLLLGEELRLSTRWSLSLDGLVYVFNSSNELDGLHLNYEIINSYQLGKGRKLVLRLGNSITTRSRTWLTENKLLYYYSPRRGGVLIAAAGRTTRPTIHFTSEELFTSAYPSPIGNNSTLSHYLKLYASLRNTLHLTSHLRTNALFHYEDRRPHPLSPIPLERHQALVGELGLYYDFTLQAPSSADYPRASQSPRGYFAPEVGLSYRVGFDPTAGRSHKPFSRFQMLELSLRYAYAFSERHRLHLGIVAGGFLDRRRLSDADEYYLPDLPILSNLPIDGRWTTLPTDYVAGDRWLWAHADYKLHRGVLSFALPHLLDEALHLRAFYGKPSARWYEAGYSVGLGEMARLGFFVGSNFRQGSRPNFSLKLSLPLLILQSKASSRY